MSGPNDSGVGGTSTGDFKLPIWDATSPRALSPRFRLQLHLEPLHLEWRPVLGVAAAPNAQPTFLKLDDPYAAMLNFESYMVSGSLLFDMRRINFVLIDNAFLAAPIAPPNLLPSFAQMKAWEDDAFYGRLGRTAPLFGAPAPSPLLTPPLIAPPPPSPFYKLPNPSAIPVDAVAPKVGSVGDVLKAVTGLPIVQDLQNKVGDEALGQLRAFKADWDQSPWLDRSLEIALTAPLAASVVGTVLGVDPARHFAFNLLKGKEIPLPPVPGLSLQIDNFGKADPVLLGSKPVDAQHPQPVQFGLKFDLLKAIPAIRKVF